MLPKIQNCLICDELKVGTQGRNSIVGFYGIPPDVTIVFTPQTGVKKLTFVFVTGAEGAPKQSTSLLVRVSDSIGTVLLQSPESVINLSQISPGKRLQFAFTIWEPTFPSSGIFPFALLENDTTLYRSIIAVQYSQVEARRKSPNQLCYYPFTRSIQ